jgi:hypothetical protein
MAAWLGPSPPRSLVTRTSRRWVGHTISHGMCDTDPSPGASPANWSAIANHNLHNHSVVSCISTVLVKVCVVL